MRKVPYLSFVRGTQMVYVYHVRQFTPAGFNLKAVSKQVRLIRPGAIGRVCGGYCRLEHDPGEPVQFIPWSRLYPDHEYAEASQG